MFCFVHLWLVLARFLKKTVEAALRAHWLVFRQGLCVFAVTDVLFCASVAGVWAYFLSNCRTKEKGRAIELRKNLAFKLACVVVV